jgi:hypothetical protein
MDMIDLQPSRTGLRESYPTIIIDNVVFAKKLYFIFPQIGSRWGSIASSSAGATRKFAMICIPGPAIGIHSTVHRSIRALVCHTLCLFFTPRPIIGMLIGMAMFASLEFTFPHLKSTGDVGTMSPR